MGLTVNLTLTADQAGQDFDTWVSSRDERDAVFEHDPIDLACASYRQGVEGGPMFADFQDLTVTDGDREMAELVRRYYRDRIMMAMLKQPNTTDFRRKLYALCTGDTRLKQRDIGLLYRLPYFYQEDLAVDRVIAGTESVPGEPSGRYPLDVIGQFTQLERVHRFRRSADCVVHWLRGTDRPWACAIVTRRDNGLLPLLESALARQMPIQAQGYIRSYPGANRDRHYLQLANIKLV